MVWDRDGDNAPLLVGLPLVNYSGVEKYRNYLFFKWVRPELSMVWDRDRDNAPLLVGFHLGN